MKMYELQQAYTDILELDLEEQDLESVLGSLQDSIKEKAENIAKVINQIEAEGVAFDNEIKRLQAKKTASYTKVSKLKEYLSEGLQSMNIDKLQGELFKFSFRKSESVVIDDEEKVPADFVIIKEVKTISKTEIKKAFKLGLVEGCHLEVKQNLQIK